MAATQDVARASLYRGLINLWVEDELTRAYLSAVWDGPAVAFFIGGGNEGVRAIVKDAEEAGITNVFALIDRDFRQTNKQDWLDPNKQARTFILRVHEIENHLLDANALASIRLNNLGKTPSDIEALMSAAASRLSWWAACKQVVAELRHRFCGEFLGHPKCSVDTAVKARDHIVLSPWFQKLASEVGRTTEAEVRQLLRDAHIAANQCLADGRWKDEFAGKEVLRDIGSRICDRTRMASDTLRGSEFDADLAKEVGAWQRHNNAVPQDLLDLFQALRVRITRPPSGP